jgi:hypothetical protein
MFRWWNGVAWTEHQTLIDQGPPSTGNPPSGRIRTLKILIGLTLLSVPVNMATIAWANKASEGATQCNPPQTWDEAALGTWIPLTFVALSLGCLVAAVVTYVRSGHASPRPIRMRMVVLALVGLIAAVVSGFLAAFSVGWINVCF